MDIQNKTNKELLELISASTAELIKRTIESACTGIQGSSIVEDADFVGPRPHKPPTA